MNNQMLRGDRPRRALGVLMGGLLVWVLTLAMLSSPVRAEGPAAAPQVPHGPGGQAAPQVGLVLVPALEGYPAGETLPLVILARLPQGVRLLVPPAAGASGSPVDLELDPGQGAAVKGLELARPSPDGVQRGRTVLVSSLAVAADARPGPRQLTGRLTMRLARGDGPPEPVVIPLTLPIEVLPAGSALKVVSPEMLARLGVAAPGPGPAPSEAGEPTGDPFSDASLLWMLLAAFGIGLGLNLTPCVYPMIPLTVSFFGGRAAGGQAARFLGAAAYWLGITAMYTALGSFAALTGNILGQWLTHPAVVLGLAAVLMAMAASMFGLWEFRMPAALNRTAAVNRAGVGGAFLMGLTAGVLAAPCAGPAVVGLMTHVAKVGDVAYGMASFFLLSAGLGLPLAVLAYFSELIARLPGAGDWMVWVRKFFGVVLVLMALSIARPLMGDTVFRWLMVAAGGLGGLYLAFLERSGRGGFVTFKRIVGVALVLLAAGFWWYTAPPQGGHLEWTPYTPAVFKEAAAKKRPAVVDFSADWCAPCRQLEAETFSDPRVQAALADFWPLRVDVTTGGNADDKALMKAWLVRGVPTVVFMGPDGNPVHELTLVGFEGPDRFLARIRAVKDRFGGGGK